MEKKKTPEAEENKPDEILEDLTPEKDAVGGLRRPAVGGIQPNAQKKELTE